MNEIDNEYFTTSDVLDAQPPVFCIVNTAWSKVIFLHFRMTNKAFGSKLESTFKVDNIFGATICRMHSGMAM